MAAEAGVSSVTMKRVKQVERQGHGDAIRSGRETVTSLRQKASKERPRTRMELLLERNSVLEEEKRLLRGRLDVSESGPEGRAAE